MWSWVFWCTYASSRNLLSKMLQAWIVLHTEYSRKLINKQGPDFASDMSHHPSRKVCSSLPSICDKSHHRSPHVQTATSRRRFVCVHAQESLVPRSIGTLDTNTRMIVDRNMTLSNVRQDMSPESRAKVHLFIRLFVYQVRHAFQVDNIYICRLSSLNPKTVI